MRVIIACPGSCGVGTNCRLREKLCAGYSPCFLCDVPYLEDCSLGDKTGEAAPFNACSPHIFREIPGFSIISKIPVYLAGTPQVGAKWAPRKNRNLILFPRSNQTPGHGHQTETTSALIFSVLNSESRHKSLILNASLEYECCQIQDRECSRSSPSLVAATIVCEKQTCDSHRVGSGSESHDIIVASATRRVSN